MLKCRNLAILAIVGIVILANFCFPMKAIATTQDLQINSTAGYTIQARFSYDEAQNIEVIRESGKGKTQAIDSLVVSFYNPAGEIIASYDNITDGVATGEYFEFNFDLTTQQLLGQIDLGGESAGEMYLKGEVDGELSLIEIDASGEEKAIDVVRSRDVSWNVPTVGANRFSPS